MAKALRAIAVVAGAVALVATGVGAVVGAGTFLGVAGSTFATIGQIAGVVAGVASVGSRLLTRPPPARGSVTETLIDIDPPSPYVMGEGYFAGIMRHRVGYGPTLNKVPNPYLWEVLALCVAGPIEGPIVPQVDFGEVTSYYSGWLATDTRLGARPDTSLVPLLHGPAPGWGGASHLSSVAAIGWNHRFDKDGRIYASGLPTRGVLAKWVKVYDPRKDSTRAGGSGAHRLGDEATYEWSENPALHAATYAFGRYVNGERVMGVGLPDEGIDWEGTAAWANDCDANGWRLFGVVYEGLADDTERRWENLREICIAGGAEPLFSGAVLGFHWQRPRVALDTVTAEDLADGPQEVTAMQSWRDRLNTLRPRYTSAEHNWTLVQAEPVQVASYLTEDGQVRAEDVPFNFVKDKDQAAQLAAYWLVNSREITPITLTVMPRLRAYRPGECLRLELPDLGLDHDAIILRRVFDPATMTVQLTLVTEDPAKHDFALGRTGVAPPTPSLTDSASDRDLIARAARAPFWPEVDGPGRPEDDATVGALIPLPDEYDLGTGVVGNIKRADGTLYLPGELLNTSIALSPSGRLEYRPLPGSAPVGIGQIALPDLGAASQVALRRAEDDVDALAEALATALDEASRTRQTFTDAGFYSDPATGQVRIHAIEQTRERVSSAEIRLNAAEAQINLRATVNYVDEAILNAVIDPSQIADLETVFLRLTAAEIDIDGLNATVTTLATATELSLVAGRVTTAESAIDALEGTVATKVDTTTFNALETRVTSAESTLTAIGDTASIVNAVRSVRLVEREQDANAEADLRALLQGDRAQRDQVAAIAAARQELRTDIREGDAAEAVARLALQVRVGAVEASVATESVARISGQNALAAQITSLTASLNTETANRVAAINSANQARIDGDALIAAGLAQQVTASRVADGEAAGQAEQLLAALLQDDKTRRETNGALAGARQEITAQVIEGDQAIATSVSALAARVAGNEASIVEERQARTTADQSIAQSVTSLNASFTTQLSAETTARIAAIAQEADARGQAITTERDLRIAAIEAEAAARGTAITAEEQARIAAINAEAAARQQAVTTLTASIQSEATARADADGALASSISTLTTTVNGNTASIATFAESINGLQARAGIRLDVNGRVIGWVLNNNGNQGTMDVVADTFRIFAPGMAAARAPFEFSDGNLRLSGDVRVGGDLVVDGSLSAQKFEANGVTRAYETKNAAGIELDVMGDIVTIAIEMERPGTIILIANAQFTYTSGSWDVELAVDSTILQTGSSNNDRFAGFAGTFVAGVAGTYTAKLRAAGTNVFINAGGASLVALRTYI